MADNEELLNLKHDVERHETDLDKLAKDVSKLRKELNVVRDGLTAHRNFTGETMTLLMWFTEQVRSFAINAATQGSQAQSQAIELDNKARELLETLKKRLSQ
jgi:hypothetical protein